MKKYTKLAICLSITLFHLSFTLSVNAFQATFTPRISVGEEYSDNHFLTKENKKDEFITTVSPGFTAEIIGKTSNASISYDPQYANYNRYDENNTWRHNAKLSGFAEIAKNLKLYVKDSFLLTEDPQTEADIAFQRSQDPETVIDSTIRKSRNKYYTNTANVNLNYQFGEADHIVIGYTHYLLENDDPDIEDKKRNNPSLGLTYWFTPLWGFEFNGHYNKGDFDTSDDLEEWSGNAKLVKKLTRHFDMFIQYRQTTRNYEGDTEDDKTYNPSIGFNYEVAEDMSFSVDIGYFINDYERREDKTGLTGNADLIKHFRRGSITFTGSGGYDYSNFGAENLGFSQFYEAAGSGRYQFTKNISGNVFGSYRNDEYKDTIPERDDTTTRAGLGVTIQPIKWMSVGFNYTFRSVDSTIIANEYDENRIFVSISLSPSLPFRLSQ